MSAPRDATRVLANCPCSGCTATRVLANVEEALRQLIVRTVRDCHLYRAAAASADRAGLFGLEQIERAHADEASVALGRLLAVRRAARGGRGGGGE